MNEKKIILTETQFDEALRITAMGGAGLLNPTEIPEIIEKFPQELSSKILASAMAAGCIRTEGPGKAILKVLKMIAEQAEQDKNAN